MEIGRGPRQAKKMGRKAKPPKRDYDYRAPTTAGALLSRRRYVIKTWYRLQIIRSGYGIGL